MKQPMPNQQQSASHYSVAIDELRRLARERFETPTKLLQLRRRIATGRAHAHRQILERIAQQAHVDLQPIFEEARRRNAVKRRYVTETLTRLEAEAKEHAKTQKNHFLRIRSDYLKTFSNQLSGPQAKSPELKFHQPIVWTSEAHPGDCNEILGSACGNQDLGTYEASADIAPGGNNVGMWLYPYIYTDGGDCEDTLVGTTLQDLTYEMGPPATSFAVNAIRVDLVGNGIASAVLGDYGWPDKANPYYEHSFVELDVYIAQQVNGEWQQWPLLSDRLFEGKGDYSRQIRSLLSGQTYPTSIIIRKSDLGGGDLLCHLQIACSTRTLGSDGRVRIDFSAPDHGIFVGGVALIGDYV